MDDTAPGFLKHLSVNSDFKFVGMKERNRPCFLSIIIFLLLIFYFEENEEFVDLKNGRKKLWGSLLKTLN